MRRKVSGLETFIRKEVPHLLDLHGDICHHAHNVVKKFPFPFGKYIEQLFSDNPAKMHWSPDLRQYLAEICKILNIPADTTSRRHHIPCCIMYVLLYFITYYCSFYLVFYWKHWIHKIFIQIFYSKVICYTSVVAKKRLFQIRKVCSKKSSTPAGKERKMRIIEKYCTQERKQIYISIFTSTCYLFLNRLS